MAIEFEQEETNQGTKASWAPGLGEMRRPVLALLRSVFFCLLAARIHIHFHIYVVIYGSNAEF